MTWVRQRRSRFGGRIDAFEIIISVIQLNQYKYMHIPVFPTILFLFQGQNCVLMAFLFFYYDSIEHLKREVS